MNSPLKAPGEHLPYDTLTSLEGAQIQHGPNNNRIYLMDLRDADPERLIVQMRSLASENGYGKVFAKVPEHRAGRFLSHGYRVEARIPGFYPECDALLLGLYPEPQRAKETQTRRLHQVLQLARHNLSPVHTPTTGADVRRCQPKDADAMAQLYRQVFPSYPFAIDHPDFLHQSMEEDVDYFCIEQQGELMALAAAEKSPGSMTVEMTDFATNPEARGQGLANLLLRQMEQEVSAEGYRVAYTIARAYSVGMNRTFARQRYQLAGRLTNNTQISGHIETMNVWYKTLR